MLETGPVSQSLATLQMPNKSDRKKMHNVIREFTQCQCCEKNPAHKRIEVAGEEMFVCKSCSTPIPRALQMISLSQLASMQKDFKQIADIIDIHVTEPKLEFEPSLNPDLSMEEAYFFCAQYLKFIVKENEKLGASREYWKSPEGKSVKRNCDTLRRAFKICSAVGRLSNPNQILQ